MRPYNSDRVLPVVESQVYELRKRAATQKQIRNIVRNHEGIISTKLEGITAETLPNTCPLHGFKQSDPTGFQHPLGCYGAQQGRCLPHGRTASSTPPADYLGCTHFGFTVTALHDRKELRSEVPVYLQSLVQLVRSFPES